MPEVLRAKRKGILRAHKKGKLPEYKRVCYDISTRDKYNHQTALVTHEVTQKEKTNLKDNKIKDCLGQVGPPTSRIKTFFNVFFYA